MNKNKTIRFLTVVTLLWASFAFYSCTESESNLEKLALDKFNNSWQSDSLPWVIQTRVEVAEMAPKSPAGFYSKAWLLSKNGSFDKALKTADSLIIGYPSFDKGWYLRANLKSEMRDTLSALHDFNECLKRNPSFFEAHVNRGNLHFHSGSLDFALKDFEAANSIRPLQKTIQINLGNTYMMLKQKDKACRFWHVADSLGEKQAAVYLLKFCGPETI